MYLKQRSPLEICVEFCLREPCKDCESAWASTVWNLQVKLVPDLVQSVISRQRHHKFKI